ncbi:pentatricopeptide repeat-containing protein At1g09410, mitochondrial [Selaginella moellendorffii]|uniref:pentatricopeptide repeat-containing protein At1g09410, mitochondrial n=1 Tax=Selaginella moellendorffii TaxID=88036 RepID=UPI000D1D035D|nr:pentatricopeptide repeat-containing protein At1g09410, mitochondrial [Selaginella moellendorffii]|eukprot:XP_024519257.1 pentatricopeptide repeat-containing protein At1g09410, mitochondrial [Selaginella moellendorffii]
MQQRQWASLVRQCRSVAEGKQLERRLGEAGLECDTYLGNLLVQMYAACGQIEEARQVFERIPRKNRFSWNTMLGASITREEEAKRLFDMMPERDVVSWNAMITAYAAIGHLGKADELFACMRERNSVSWTGMVAAYSSDGRIVEAIQILEVMPQHGIVAWNAIITACARLGHCATALGMFHDMELQGVEPDRVTMLAVSDACASSLEKESHEETMSASVDQVAARMKGFLPDTVVATALVRMYGRCHRVAEAESVFRDIANKSIVSWNVMLSAFARNGCVEDASALFHAIPDGDKNTVSWNALLSAYNYAQGGSNVANAWKVFEEMPLRDVVSWTTLVSVCARNGSVEEAVALFDKMPQRSRVSWNSIVSGLSQNGRGREALQVFRVMVLEGVEADTGCFASVLGACADMEDLEQGSLVHQEITSTTDGNTLIATAVVNMYGKCGQVSEAKSAFDQISRKTSVAWNTLLSIYGLNAKVAEAKELFSTMPGWNSVSWTSMVVALAQNGLLDEARDMFEQLPERTLVSWNAMLTAYAQNKHGRQALSLLAAMDSEGVTKPDRVTLITALNACADVGALAQGKELHQAVDEEMSYKHRADVSVATALLNMYGRCGSVEQARRLFEAMPRHDIVSWTAIVSAYARCRQAKVSLQLFRAMELEGMLPNEISFVSIVSACSAASLVEDGRTFFLLIYRYAAGPSMEQWACMVELLGRSGQLTKAEEVLENMPLEPDASAWRALVAASRLHNDNERARRAARNAAMLVDPWPPLSASPSQGVLASIQEALLGEGRGRPRSKGGVSLDHISAVEPLLAGPFEFLKRNGARAEGDCHPSHLDSRDTARRSHPERRV